MSMVEGHERGGRASWVQKNTGPMGATEGGCGGAGLTAFLLTLLEFGDVWLSCSFLEQTEYLNLVPFQISS